jgi:hypothetical protein
MQLGTMLRNGLLSTNARSAFFPVRGDYHDNVGRTHCSFPFQPAGAGRMLRMGSIQGVAREPTLHHAQHLSHPKRLFVEIGLPEAKGASTLHQSSGIPLRGFFKQNDVTRS